MGTQSALITFPIILLCINSADMSSITKIDQLNWSIKSPLFPLMLGQRHGTQNVFELW
jgi:hypothetical protein